jgi:hypothetical protein
LLLLRGRSREQVLAELRTRRRRAAPGPAGLPEQPGIAGRAADRDETDVGVDARDVFGGPPPTGPVPTPPLPPTVPGQPAPLPAGPSALPSAASSRTLENDLLMLAADAARRAWELAVGAGDGGMALDRATDLARRADQLLGTPSFPALVARLGADGRVLARQGLAWRYGGAGGLAALDDDGAWTATQPLDVAIRNGGKTALAELTGSSPRVTRNRVTAGGAQLRLGRDGLWYPYTKDGSAWDPAGPADLDPVRAAAVL